ncbi:MAG: O-antigen ligase family protein [Nigerium sp.]|nr:O-antigen ligase family protein [Nigerium sp.]
MLNSLILPSYSWSIMPVVSLLYALICFFSLVALLPDHSDWVPVWYILGATAVAFTLFRVNADTLAGLRFTIGDADENFISMILCIAFALAVHRFFRCRWMYVPIVIPVIGLVGAGAIVTGSRTGAISLIVTLVIAVFGFMRRNLRRSAIMVVLSIVGYLIIQTWTLLPNRLLAAPIPEALADRGGRADIAELYLRHADQWVIFGVGYGNAPYFLLSVERLFAEAHGLWLGLVIEAGIVGLAAFIGVLLAVIRSAQGGLFHFLALSPIMVFGLSVSGLERSAILWFVLAIALRICSDANGKASLPVA